MVVRESVAPGHPPGKMSRPCLCASSAVRIAVARPESGTACSSVRFMRSGGMVQSTSFSSTFRHSAFKASLIRAPVRIAIPRRARSCSHSGAAEQRRREHPPVD